MIDWQSGVRYRISSDEKEKLITLISQQGFDALDEIGWEHDDTEVYFFGTLNIEEIS